MPQMVDLAPGHTAVESSALRSYKYDPGAREFEVHPSGGNTIYVYGDVSPAEAQAFEQAPSKGQAWQAIRRNPLVGKIVNGERIAMKGGMLKTPQGTIPKSKAGNSCGRSEIRAHRRHNPNHPRSNAYARA